MDTPDPVRSPISAKLVVRTVAEFRGISPSQLAGPRRDRRLAWPRQEACWILQRRSGMSLPRIGRFLGGRDHTTILYGVAAVERRRADDPDYRTATDNLMALIDAKAVEITAGTAAPETVRCIARRLIRDPWGASREDVLRLASGVLTVAAVHADPALGDAEARAAGRQLLSSPVGASLSDTL